MKILLVDDHVLIREALRGVLKELKADATVLEAPDCAPGDAADRRASRSGPRSCSISTCRTATASRSSPSCASATPPSPIVVLSGFHDRDNVVRALDLGALGFIPKSSQREVMVSALRLVFSGGIYIPPEILVRAGAGDRSGRRRSTRTPRSRLADLGLTERQIEVLALMMQGKSNKAICRMLDLAEPTVKNHVTAILKALKVTNRTEAVIAVGALGWELPPVPDR